LGGGIMAWEVCFATRTRVARALCASALAGALVLAAASYASAAQLAHRGTQEEQAACMPDVFRLCFSDIPDERAIVACLIRSKRQLSPGCGNVFGVKARVVRTASKAKQKKIMKRRKIRRV
jgi:hypothetical protein